MTDSGGEAQWQSTEKQQEKASRVQCAGKSRELFDPARAVKADRLPGSKRLLLASRRPAKTPNVLEEYKEMHRVRRGGDEIEFQVKAPRFLVFRVYRKGAYAGNVGRLQRAQH